MICCCMSGSCRENDKVADLGFLNDLSLVTYHGNHHLAWHDALSLQRMQDWEE